MSFLEQAGNIKTLESIEYCCFSLKIDGGLSDKMHIRHVFGKMDDVMGYGDYHKPELFICLFYQICEYLRLRGYKYRLRFRWTFVNSPYFNIKCAWLMFIHRKALPNGY